MKMRLRKHTAYPKYKAMRHRLWRAIRKQFTLRPWPVKINLRTGEGHAPT